MKLNLLFTYSQQDSGESLSFNNKNRGFSFIELIVTAAIVSMVFGSLLLAVNTMMKVISDSKAKAGATAMMVERMEYFRSLPYNSVGTVSGVPPGVIPQNSTTTQNGIVYTERVLVEYVDDPADGFGGADSNGILSDYKRVKIEYKWKARGGNDKVVSLVSNIMPAGIETTDGGGTIRVNVFDASVQPVESAEVRFVNTSSSTYPIDTTKYTDASGVAYLSGAPAMANYEIYVTKPGYSSDSTYTATTSNPTPTVQPVAVIESSVSTMNFQIDELSDLFISTNGIPTYNDFTDSFVNSSLLATTSSTTVAGGEVVLTDSLGVYALNGSALSTTTSPATIDSWYGVSFTATSTASSSAVVQVYFNNGGTLERVPDLDLPGNSAGFTSSPIDISGLDIATYDELALGVNLTTTDSSETPALLDWTIEYIESQPDLAGVDIEVRGNKIIGTGVYKYEATHTTDGAGEIEINDVEYDVYSVEVDPSSYSVREVCDYTPVNVPPDSSINVDMILGAPTSAGLLVSVTDASNQPIANATVNLSRTGVDITQETSLCGQTYFTGGLPATDDYVLDVTASGFSGELIDPIEINATSTIEVSLGT